MLTALELPLEQASRLLEEQDFQDVLNKIPDETFDMFSGIPTALESSTLIITPPMR
jgi:hypothetical protein